MHPDARPMGPRDVGRLVLAFSGVRAVQSWAKMSGSGPYRYLILVASRAAQFRRLPGKRRFSPVKRKEHVAHIDPQARAMTRWGTKSDGSTQVLR